MVELHLYPLWLLILGGYVNGARGKQFHFETVYLTAKFTTLTVRST
jgi:hypothetical protein